jgi:ESF2/ABP1 family protein
MSTLAGQENQRKRKRSSNADTSPKNKLRQLTDESPAESEAEQSQSPESEHEDSGDGIQWHSDDFDELEDDEDDEDGEDALSENEAEPSSTPSNTQPKKKLKPVSQNKVAQSREATAKTGVIYLSRIPPKLNPTKIRQLLSVFNSPVLRIFLAPESQAVYLRRTKSGDSKKRQFTEGWVEFADKKVAKKVVLMLNAERIGGRKGDKWYDDLWCMKYLPKFKWHHLTEQIGAFPPLCVGSFARPCVCLGWGCGLTFSISECLETREVEE